MTSLRSSFVIILLFNFLIKETISLEEIKLPRNSASAPIALVRDRKSPQWALAVPHYCDGDDDHVGYFYNDSEDNDVGLPKQEFKPACPRFSPKEFKSEKHWKLKSDLRSINNVLFFTMNYIGPDRDCPGKIVSEPSIIKVEQSSDGELNCGLSGAEMLGVGYPISKYVAGDAQFLPVYTFCYTYSSDSSYSTYSISRKEIKAKFWYTIHHIASPSLLLRKEIREFYELDPSKVSFTYFESTLDGVDNVNSYDREKHYAYNFVGTDDMPTKVWEVTSTLSLNYTLILKNKDSFMGMIRADHYIRLYSRLTDQPLTLYSGVHRTKELLNNDDKTHLLKIVYKLFTPLTPVDLSWRVITTIDEKQAIVLVTQHSFKKCSKFYVCDKNSITMVKEYEMGGCTYTCSLSWSTIELLGLPQKTSKDELDLTINITKSTQVSEFTLEDGKESSESDGKLTTRVTTLIDFMKAENVQDAIRDAIAKAHVAKNVQNEGAPVGQVSSDRLLEQGMGQGKLKGKYLLQNS